MVKELDGQEITIVPSTVGKIVPDGTPEQEWQWCVESLQEVHEHANAAGVRIAIEPLNRFETHFVNRGEQALALADAVGPDVGVCLDCFHMNIEEVDLLETIRAIGPRLTDFHVADNNRMACGMGALDWPAIVADAEGDRLRRGAHGRVRRPDRPHAGEPLPRRAGDEPGRHQPRGAAVHHRPRQQPAVGGLLQHARRAVRDDAAPAHLSADRRIVAVIVRARRGRAGCTARSPAERQHVSDFGRIDSFDMALVRVETDDGAGRVGRGEGGRRQRRLVPRARRLHQRRARPGAVGRDPRRINAAADLLYNGPRAGYAASRGRAFPILGRRGLTVSAISGIDMALWDLLGRSLGVAVVDLWGGPCRDDMPLYASGGWADAGGDRRRARTLRRRRVLGREDARRRDRRDRRGERGTGRRRPRAPSAPTSA